VFISGGGTNLQSLIDSCADEDFPAEIAFVMSSNEDAYGLERARKHSIPSGVIKRKDFDSSEAFSDAILDDLRMHKIDIICLAGYMKLLPPKVVSTYRNFILNIHPALLPKFGGKGMYGMRVHKAVIAAGEAESGPTAHLVDEIYDHGEIVTQKRVPVLPDDTPEDLQKRVLAAEHELYPEAVRILAMKIISKEARE
jgi:phosphoribosylglycinamide formyltransferase-1